MKKTVTLKTNKKNINLDRFEGKWVAFIDNKPVNADKNLNLLMDKVKKSHYPKEPSVMLIPHKGEGPYILILSL